MQVIVDITACAIPPKVVVSWGFYQHMYTENDRRHMHSILPHPEIKQHKTINDSQHVGFVLQTRPSSLGTTQSRDAFLQRCGQICWPMYTMCEGAITQENAVNLGPTMEVGTFLNWLSVSGEARRLWQLCQRGAIWDCIPNNQGLHLHAHHCTNYVIFYSAGK